MNVLVVVPVKERHMEKLQAAAPGYNFRFRNNTFGKSILHKADSQAPETKEDVQWADIILGNAQAGYICGSEKLRWLQTSSAGVDPYAKPGVLAEHTLVTNATGAYGLAISEHMLGMLLGIQKKLAMYRDLQRQEEWKSLGGVTSIYGATVLVLGMGDIGGEFAKRCKALGAYVIGMRRADTAKPDYADEICLTADLDKVLPRADVVASSLPGTPATTGMLSRERIAMMKDGAIVLNVGRGSVIDTEALCDALESGKLMGAGLDVTEPEPLPKGHRLWQIPNAIVTPHISGFYHLPETHERIINIFAENLQNFAQNKALRNPVDLTRGYAAGIKPQ